MKQLTSLLIALSPCSMENSLKSFLQLKRYPTRKK